MDLTIFFLLVGVVLGKLAWELRFKRRARLWRLKAHRAWMEAEMQKMDDMEAEWERRRREAENDRRPPCPPTSP